MSNTVHQEISNISENQRENQVSINFPSLKRTYPEHFTEAYSLNNGKLNVKLPEQLLYTQGTGIYAHFLPLAQDLINNPCSPTNSYT